MSENLVGAKLGNFRLERLLGRGRMGVVYLAHDEALLRPTAVKILSWSIPESGAHNPEAWFIAEARNVARVNHPHVVQIYGVARHGAHCYIAMEYVDGTTADEWIVHNGPFSVERATELLIQTASALQAAHDANVVHRDIKPENLLVGSDGKAKLGDFGMAMHTARPRVGEVTRAGTPYYTAPEIWRGYAASVSSDIYALGATYYCLLTGRPPFVENDLQGVINAHLYSPVPEIKSHHGNVPAGCQELVRRCMEKTPQQRLPSAQAVGWEARALLHRRISIPPSSATALGVASQIQTNSSVVLNTVEHPLPELNPVPVQTAHWHSFYGFVREPFAGYEVGHAPYQGEPFLSLLTHLKEHLNRLRGTTVLLVGEGGAGRTGLAQELLMHQACRGPCVQVSCDGLGSGQTLAKKVLRALGTPTITSGSSSDDVDILVEHCLAIGDTESTPLLVVDDCERNVDVGSELMAIARAAQHANGFNLLLLGSPEFEKQWTESSALYETAFSSTVSIPALNGSEVAAYVTSWLESTLAPGVAPVVFTPDAILILAHRSQGVLAQINCLVSNMLLTAAPRGRRVLDSWAAWTAPLGSSAGIMAARPASWPTVEALEVLNRCRQQAGMQSRR